MILRFKDWLIDQQSREDDIGDLARVLTIQDISHKLSGRKVDEHKSWVDVVVKIERLGHVAVFNEAWQEFMLAKQVATDIGS